MEIKRLSNVKLGSRSVERLNTINPTLRAVVLRAFETMPFDITVIEGIRTKERQRELVASGASLTMNSKHLTGNAVDLAPYPVDWNNKARFNLMADHVLAAAKEMGVRIRWGGDWNMNGEWKDERFYDGPHFELLS
ncbi:hypothetical protein [Aeromonas phage 13AhydR10PP]|nr:hypothetical protein [Aeromonas phage 13AhydR10PP]